MENKTTFGSRVICILLSGEKFNEGIIKLVPKFKNKKVCYVTLNKGADVLKEAFKKKV